RLNRALRTCGHGRDPQILDRDQAVVADEPYGGLRGEVSPPRPDPGVQAAKLSAHRVAALGPAVTTVGAQRPGQSLLQTPDPPLLAGGGGLPVVQVAAGGDDRGGGGPAHPPARR